MNQYQSSLKSIQPQEDQRVKSEKERKHLFYLANREKILERNKRWALAHPESRRATYRKFHKLHPAILTPEQKVVRKVYSHNYYLQNKDRIAELRRIRIRANPSLHSSYVKRHLAKRKGAEGKHSEQEWRELLRIYNYKCAKCGSTSDLTRDHKIPLSKGGTDNIDNITPLCRSCNSIKHTQTWFPTCKVHLTLQPI
jgi:5-methylcytosine-specific restriction endonuclease McrA